jgi:hypothetical protein
MNATVQTLPLDQIVVDPTVQIRKVTRDETIARYMECFEYLPPVVVYDLGDHLLLADGFHRHGAASRLVARGELNPPVIKAEVRQGTREDALEYAVLANAATGEKLSIEERDAGIRRLRQLHPRHAEREIARMMGVHESCVHRLVVVDRVRQEVLWKPAGRISDTLVYEVGLAERHHWANLLKAADRRNWTRDDLRRVRDIIGDDDAPEEYRHKLLAGDADPVPAGAPYPVVTVIRMDDEDEDVEGGEPEVDGEIAAAAPQRAGWRDPVGSDVPERYNPVRARLVLEYSQPNPEPPRHRGIREYKREALDIRIVLDGTVNNRATDGLGDPRDPTCDHGLAYLLRVLSQKWWRELSPKWPQPPEAPAQSALR